MNLYYSTISRHNNKNIEYPKKCFPLEPRYAGMCTFITKKNETQAHAILDTGSYNFILVPEPIRTPSKIQDLSESISMPYSQPLPKKSLGREC